MGGQQPVGDISVLQIGQSVRATRVEAQEVLDVVLLPVVIHHERRRGHYRWRGRVCLGRNCLAAASRIHGVVVHRRLAQNFGASRKRFGVHFASVRTHNPTAIQRAHIKKVEPVRERRDNGVDD